MGGGGVFGCGARGARPRRDGSLLLPLSVPVRGTRRRVGVSRHIAGRRASCCFPRPEAGLCPGEGRFELNVSLRGAEGMLWCCAGMC